MKPFAAFLKKEFYHIFRDTRTMMILLAMPVILIILFGYAITTEMKGVPVAILDYSRDGMTQKLSDRLLASEYFDLYACVQDEKEIQQLFREGKISLAFVHPPRSPRREGGSLPFGEVGGVQILADATDPNQAAQLAAYANAIIGNSLSNLPEGEASLPPSGGTRGVLLYNPQMKGAYNFVPGVMGLILMLICALMTSVGIVREKEMGTMEVLLVSPLKPVYIILAKAVPYLLLSIVNIATILLLAYFLLEVPVAGSLALLVGISILYALVSLCFGLLVSTIADTGQAAMLISGMVLMLPVILLSGMIFPIENMPGILQWLSHVVPAKWYIIAVKDVMIKGLGVRAILAETGILLLMAVALVALSIKRFNQRLA
jgi:ABC-2 type transport system permease protein